MDNPEKLEPGLYIVPTPIGNTEDITLRAMRILSSADIVACEDTRHTGNLLRQYNIHATRLVSHHEHNERGREKYLIEEINTGKSVALVSDAGTPGISDPGYPILHEAIENGIKIYHLPGATAFVPALLASGLPIHQFIFLGFPPQKKGRKTFLTAATNYKLTSILYESPHRIEKRIDELIEHCGENRKACISREISKVFEQYVTAPLFELKRLLGNGIPIKGEFVVVLDGLRDKDSKEESQDYD